MRDIAMRALDTATQRGAAYADVRVVRFKSESVAVRNKNVEALASDESLGFGVRVIVDGYWGFASSHNVTLQEADEVAAEAVRIARASAIVRGPRADIGPPQASSGSYRTPFVKDPFAVSLDDKIALLLSANQLMSSVPNIISAEGNIYCQREDKLFGNSEGAWIEQE
ncbi:MAG TPA: DNA gyrase modulator, partial [Dehalococcoidia bacterium]